MHIYVYPISWAGQEKTFVARQIETTKDSNFDHFYPSVIATANDAGGMKFGNDLMAVDNGQDNSVERFIARVDVIVLG